MNTAVKVLSVVLLVQLALWLALQFSGGSAENDAPALLSESMAAADDLSMEIQDADGNSVKLSRTKSAGEGNTSNWLLESGLPADGKKADALVEKLAALSLGWPVSTNSDSHDRFEVADDKFQRRLSVSSGESKTTLHFGTSPGYQQVHARGENVAVYAVKIANYELPAEADDWLEKSLLEASGEVVSVAWSHDGSNSAQNVTVTRAANASEGWMLEGKLANIEATDRAVSRVAELKVLGALTDAPKAPPADAKQILVQDADGEYRLSFWPREANNDHVVVSTRFPDEAFRMANFVAEQLVPKAAELEPPALPEIDLQNLTPDLATDPESDADLDPDLDESKSADAS